MANLEQEIIDELQKPQDKKLRYNFTLSESTKAGFAAWCKEHKFKESTALDALIKKAIPQRFFKR
jgi:hypothetical protein